MTTDRIRLPVGEEIGGHAGAVIQMTPSSDKRRVELVVPPDRVIPIVFIPGIMGSHLRMSNARQRKLERDNNIAWRPDDTKDTAARYDASPRERQLNFDPDETEVDRYEITENDGAFDMTGETTLNSDARHMNVPHDLTDIGLLMSAPLPPEADRWKCQRGKHEATAAQKARWRGWSEVMYESYGLAIRMMESRMNCMVTRDGEVAEHWRLPLNIPIVGVDPAEWGATGAPLTEADIKRVANCWYPVHAMGYNWLQSNGTSAQRITKRIDALIDMYQRNGRRCEQVIIVTHSMGGLVARALLTDKYGNGIAKRILGIYHGVQPTVGAAAAYKRVRTGMDDTKESIENWVAKLVIGRNGEQVTAVFANAPGALELLPSATYPREWLRVVTSENREVMALPIRSDEPLREYFGERDLARKLGTTPPKPPIFIGTPIYDIYQRHPTSWIRLFNPAWINPADKPFANSSAATMAATRVEEASRFHALIDGLYHPNTFASYGEDSGQRAYGTVTWRVMAADTEKFGHPITWALDREDGEGRIFVRTTDHHILQLRLEPPQESGDQTVPAKASAARVRGKMVFRQAGYEHQNSYKDEKVLGSLLYSLIRIANTAAWWDK